MGEKFVKSLLKAYTGQWVEIKLSTTKRSGYLKKFGKNFNVEGIEFSVKDVAQFHVYQFAEPTIVVSYSK